jgi:dTDP-4-amino-4,6-dideoxygalactose transaminase
MTKLSDEAAQFVRHGVERLIEVDGFGTGRNVSAFEEEFAAYTGMDRGVAVSSGSMALELLVRILGSPGDRVLVPVNTSFATLMAVERAGLKGKLVDIDPQVLAPSLSDLQNAFDPAVVGVMFVHMGGIISPSIGTISEWCSAAGIWLIEDCAHAHGSELNGRAPGSFGTAGAYSFFKTKMVAAGEGGMIVTNDAALADKAALQRSLGKKPQARNVHISAGTNGRMTEMSALVGRAAMLDLDERVARRRRACSAYHRKSASLASFSMIPVKEGDNGYRAPGYLTDQHDREQVRSGCAEAGIPLANEIYPLPLHQQPIAAKLDLADGSFPAAERSCRQQVCLPLDDDTSPEMAATTVAVLAEVLDR